MKFPNYGPGAQGALLQANALAADELRPYAEQRDRDQTIYKLGEHLYVERDEEESIEPLDDAVGGVLRMVGHQAGGYATFKGNGDDAYAPTADLYALPEQTDPSATWPTFWRRGLSGPAAQWAQFARGFAQAYAAYIERERIAWTGVPEIGDAVIVIPRPGQLPWVYCLFGYLGQGDVKYLRVNVVPSSAFNGAPVPDEILDLFGGVPFPPQQHEWASATTITALAPAAVRTAVGVSGPEWQWRSGWQIAAAGPYAVRERRADTVVVLQDSGSLESVAAHLHIEFSASASGALGATVTRVAGGNPAGAVIAARGVLQYGSLAGGAIPVGGSGPGWTVPGLATCPVAVLYIDGALTTFTSLRRRWINSSGFAEHDTGIRVRGRVDLETWNDRPPPSGTLQLLNTWGEEGGFYVISATDNRTALFDDVFWHFDRVTLYVDAFVASLDVNAVYSHFGLLPYTSSAQLRAEELVKLTQNLPRADAGAPAYIDVARSVLGGVQIIARLDGLGDPEYALQGGLLGTLVQTSEDATFQNGPRAVFVGELQQ